MSVSFAREAGSQSVHARLWPHRGSAGLLVWRELPRLTHRRLKTTPAWPLPPCQEAPSAPFGLRTPCQCSVGWHWFWGASRVSELRRQPPCLAAVALHLPECGPGRSGTSAPGHVPHRPQGARVHRRLPVTVEGCLQLKGNAAWQPPVPQGEAGVLPPSPPAHPMPQGKQPVWV